MNITSGIITTVVGTGVAGYGGDNGPATAALIDNPYDICLDKFGNLYITDAFTNFRIRKVDTAGIITTFAGTGVQGYPVDGVPATAQDLDFPNGLLADDTGNIYIADEGSASCRVRKVNTSGIITTVAGNGGSVYSGDGIPALNAQIVPCELTFDRSHNMYIADRANQRVYKIDTVGILYNIAGNGTVGWNGNGGIDSLAELDYPNGVNTDSCGNLYIPETGVLSSTDSGHNIRKVIFGIPPTPLISISASPNDTVCAGLGVTYTANIINGIGVSYQWLVDGVGLSGATNSSYTYAPANGDSIRCIIIYAFKCMGGEDTGSSNTINMVVTPETVPTITLTSSASATVGSIVTVNATVTGAGSSYSINWYDNGVLFNTTTIPIVTYTKGAGTDNITATVIPSSLLCFDSSTSAVFTITATNAGINYVAMSQLYIYPNPAHTVLNVDNINIQTGYRLLSIIGTVIQQGVLQPGNNSLSLEALSPDVYILEVMDDAGGKTVNKIIKE